MAKHRRANSSGQDSVVRLHLKEKNHSIQDNDVNILAREDRWFERGVNQSIFVNLEQRRWPTTLRITHLQCSTEFPP